MKFEPVLLTLVAALAGCTALPRTPGEAPETTMPPPLSAPDSRNTLTPDGGASTEAVYETVDTDAFMLRQDEASDPLPVLAIPPMSFSNATPYEMIRAVVESVKLGVAMVGEHANANVQRTTVTAWNIGGPLSEVLERLSGYTGMFYSYRGGVITFSPDAQFLTTLPPVEDLIDPLTQVVRSLGATDVTIDRFNRVLAFRASRRQLPRIEAYLRHIRERRQVITYDVSIYEVQLSDGSQLGVNWNRFAIGGKPNNVWYNNGGTGTGSSTGTTGSTGTTTGTSATGLASLLPSWFPFSDGAGNVARQAVNVASAAGGGLSVNPFFVLPGLNADVLLTFLQTQGTLRSISQPRVSLITGTKAAVRVGTTTTYVSKIGTNTGTAITSTSVETAQLKTGVDLRINADFQDGTVFTDLQIAINDLVRLRPYVALGTTLQLPDTSDRLIETRVRARPGDTIVIGGIQRDTFTHDIEGVPGPGDSVVPTSKQKATSRSELVVTLRPRVVAFMSAQQHKAATAAQARDAATAAKSREAATAAPARGPAAIEPKLSATVVPAAGDFNGTTETKERQP